LSVQCLFCSFLQFRCELATNFSIRIAGDVAQNECSLIQIDLSKVADVFSRFISCYGINCIIDSLVHASLEADRIPMLYPAARKFDAVYDAARLW